MRPIYIYVCERGFVLVGRPRNVQPDALFVTLDDCGVIRCWGTTAGLGELAAKGVLPDTKIDREPDGTQQLVTAIYRRIPCCAETWGSWPTT